MKRFVVASYGIVPPGQMTLEALLALRSCGIVFSNSVDRRTADSIRGLDIPLAYSHKVCPDLLGRIRRAFSEHERVGLLHYGNPFFLNDQLSVLLDGISHLADVRVFPGVSSVDMLINMFGLGRLAYGGLLVADLNSFSPGVLAGSSQDIFFGCPFLLNANGSARTRATFLRSVASVFPARHPVFLARATADPGHSEILRGCVSCLPALLGRCNLYHTLVILSEKTLRRGGATPQRWRGLTVKDVCCSK